MANRHIYSLLDTGFTTIEVLFEGSNRSYTYKARLSDRVEAGDLVVVDTPQRGFVIVVVDKVHDTPQIDIHLNSDYKWIVQKINLSAYRQEVERERKFADAMREVERAKQRDELVKTFRAGLPDGSEAARLFDETTAALAPRMEGRSDAS